MRNSPCEDVKHDLLRTDLYLLWPSTMSLGGGGELKVCFSCVLFVGYIMVQMNIHFFVCDRVSFDNADCMYIGPWSGKEDPSLSYRVYREKGVICQTSTVSRQLGRDEHPSTLAECV